MNAEIQKPNADLAAPSGPQRQAHKPHDRTRTAPKAKRAKLKPSGVHSARASATKSGPGRYHSDGQTKASPIKNKGAPRGFVQNTATVGKRNRKALIAMAGGIRAFKRQQRHNDRIAAA